MCTSERRPKKTLEGRPVGERASLVVLSAVLFTNGAFGAESPELGRPITPGEMASLIPQIFPDGTGLPPGGGDAATGQRLYEERCAACHGSRGTGGSAEELAGGVHGLRDEPPDKTIGHYWPYATTLFDYIRRAMPPAAAGSLSADEAYALTAYLLELNGLTNAHQTLDANSLSRIRMPNRDGFVQVDAH